MLRSQLDEQRKKLPLTNEANVVKTRRTLTQSINQHSLRVELLYNAKEDYYTKGIIPDMVTLGFKQETSDKEVTEKTVVPHTQGAKRNKKQAADNTDAQPANDEKTSRLALLRAAQQRDQHLLDNYEAPDTPMPIGAKRRSIVARMKKRMDEINKLAKGNG